MLNDQKNENEGLNEQLNNIEKNYEKLSEQNNQMLKIKDELLSGLERAIKRIDQDGNIRSTRNDLLSIRETLIENTFVETKQKEEDSRNVSQDEIYDKTSRPQKAASYVTQNYEKFKQSQEAMKKSQQDSRLINQSKF